MNSVLFFTVLVSSATILHSKHLLIETKDGEEAGLDYADNEEDDADSEITADSKEYEDAGDYAYDGPGNDNSSDNDNDDGGDGKDEDDKGKDYVINGNKKSKGQKV